MEDKQIVELYWQRDENAINETRKKYGIYIFTIANNILACREDAEECENDTYFDAWNAMPPEQPSILSSFLAMITRRRALDRYRYKNAQRRADEQTLLSLLELEECVSGDKTLYEAMREEELARALNSFLSSLPEKECNVFLRRYWYFDSIKDICRRYGYGESKVKMMLKRTRDRLSEYLEKEELI